MPKPGRRKPSESVWDEYLGDPHLDPALRKIAEAAKARNFSMRELARRVKPKRDIGSVSRSFDVRNQPQRDTIDAFARAVFLDPIRLHAELDDLTDDDCNYAVRELLGYAESTSFAVPLADAKERVRRAFREASSDAKRASIRAWALSRPHWAPLSHIDEGIQAFAKALDDKALSSLFAEAPDKDALLVLASAYRTLGFRNDEISRFIRPAIRELRRRKHAGLDGMIAVAKHSPFAPINLEEKK